MKTRTAVIALTAFIAVNFGFGKAPKFETLESKIEYAKKNYAVGLQSDNTGLVESCIKMVAKIKLRVPSADLTGLQEQLDELSITHPSETVRYKAYIASSICSNPEWFVLEKNVVNADEEQFFINAAQRLQQKLFGANNF